MITCKQCIEDLRPDNPQVRSGKYGMCGCDYCDKPSYFRELEEAKPTTEVIHRHSDMSKKEFDELNRLAGEVKYLRNKQVNKPEDRPPF